MNPISDKNLSFHCRHPDFSSNCGSGVYRRLECRVVCWSSVGSRVDWAVATDTTGVRIDWTSNNAIQRAATDSNHQSAIVDYNHQSAVYNSNHKSAATNYHFRFRIFHKLKLSPYQLLEVLNVRVLHI